MKLPLLYLVGSLAHEISDPYKLLFTTDIGHSFCIVHSQLTNAMEALQQPTFV